ncbi:hypothetical protein Fcan01_11721 [Folsomia candida]|uniref:Uncharacterized protein n=1 Tax=Folsomia candida TaxID=158441 RepID=A0A226E9J3_FOLCA|nr:hypothetical protein Fcan01_11721 [Folsomia candida]
MVYHYKCDESYGRNPGNFACIFGPYDKRGNKKNNFLAFLAIFFKWVHLAYFSVSTAHALLVMFLPCQPGLSSWMLCPSGKASPNCAIVTPLFAALEFLIFMQGAVSAGYYLQTILLLGATFLWIECGTFIKQYEAEIGQYSGYRRVQVFEKVLNACTREKIFFRAAILIPTLQIVISFAAIKMLYSGHVLIAGVLLWSYAVALCFTLLMFSVAAKVYGMSQKWITRCQGGNKKKYAKKVHKSLPPVRLQFGNNFVEVLTPLVVQEFCLRQMVSFLLVTK